MFYFNLKSEKPLLRPRSVHFRPHFRNLSHETVPLSKLSIAQSSGKFREESSVSGTGVDKNVRTICAEHLEIVSDILKLY